MDIKDFEGFVETLDIDNLQVCQQLIYQALANKLALASSKPAIVSTDINDLVEYHADYITETDREFISAELESLGFDFNPRSDKVQNRFISSSSEPYIWGSGKGDVINHPLDLDRFPVFKSLMENVNDTFGCKMNSVLASCYARGAVNCRLHDDNESTLDPSQPICVVSFGVGRKVEFVRKDKLYKHKADLVLEPTDSSIYIMKPGCQENLLHRVRRNKNIHECRFSLSFRCFVPESNEPASSSMSSQGTITSGKTSPISAPPITPTQTSTPTQDNKTQGFFPFPEQHSISSGNISQLQQHQNDRVCLLLGSSITRDVDGQRLSRGSRVVVNLSESGAKINDVHKVASDFFADNQAIVNRVDKVLINIGTNDIKWLNCRKYSVYKKFRAPLCNLIRDLKFMFPLATIVFVSVLPIRALYNYTAETVNTFNRLLIDVSRDLGCIFYDCFQDFLAPDWRDYNTKLFRDKWHLNDIGLRMLCRALKFVIFGNMISSHLRTSWHFPFYIN